MYLSKKKSLDKFYKTISRLTLRMVKNFAFCDEGIRFIINFFFAL